MQRDVISLTDHASYIRNKVTFLLDAMLGVVNLRQNAIIKTLSVAAVVLVPAHAGRLDLRHELQEHARTRHALRLSGRARPHAGRSRRAVHVFQMEEVAVISTARYCERSEAIRPLTRAGRR